MKHIYEQPGLTDHFLYISAVRHEDEKFIAADPSDDIFPAKTASDALRQTAEHFITGKMSVHVVDSLKMVNIYHEEHIMVIGAGSVKQGAYPLLRGGLVQQSLGGIVLGF